MHNFPVFFEGRKQNWEVAEDRITRQIVGQDDDVMMVIVKFETGGIGKPHNHPHTQITYISEGRFDVTISNKTKTLQKGDSFYVPSNEVHGVVCIEEGILVDVFNPARKDFITK